MSIIEITKVVKSFDEFLLNEQDIILDKHRDLLLDEDWWISTLNQIRTDLINMGFNQGVQVYFNGFYSQGDGLNIKGYYSHPSYKQKYFDFEVSEKVNDILINKHCSFSVTPIGRYSNFTVSTGFYDDDRFSDWIKELLNDLFQEYWYILRNEYEYLQSSECLINHFRDTDCYFDENLNITWSI